VDLWSAADGVSAPAPNTICHPEHERCGMVRAATCSIAGCALFASSYVNVQLHSKGASKRRHLSRPASARRSDGAGCWRPSHAGVPMLSGKWFNAVQYGVWPLESGREASRQSVQYVLKPNASR
jgi:hypothetical protein